MIDKNLDMKISLAEAMDYFQDHQHMTMEIKEYQFGSSDKNSDGFISPNEFDDDLNMDMLRASKKYAFIFQ